MSNVPPLLPLAFAAGYGIRYANQRVRRAKAAKAGPPQPVAMDPSLGDPEMRRLRDSAFRGDWDGMAAVLRPVRERADYDRLTWLIGGLDGVPEQWILPLVMNHPDDALVRTVVGARQLALAWEARTGKSAKNVTQDQFKLFHQRLRVAEEHLFAAVEMDPESAAPWYSLSAASRGLEHGAEVSRRRFEAGTRRAPFHVGLHQQQLQQICAKWGGSHEEMHTFARESLLKAPAGSALGILVPIAHLEHWLHLPKEEDAAYIKQWSVLESLREAAALSVDHPAFAPTYSPYPALNAFAMAFWLAGDKTAAGALFQRIGDNATEFPWYYRGQAGTVFAVARKECKRK